MRYVIFDIETQNTFHDVGSREPEALDISVISLYSSETNTIVSATIDTINDIWHHFEHADAIVGYNSNHFDIPILNKYYPGDLTTLKSIDILESIKESLGKRLRLDDVASATVGAKKSANGLIAVRWWKEGNIKDIIKYCEQDVKVTKKVFDYALEHKKLFYKDGTKKLEIPIDTTTWTTKVEAPLTHALFF